MRTHCYASLLAALALTAHPVMAQGTIYRWVGEDGKVQFSERRPPGDIATEEIKLRSDPPPPAAIPDPEPATERERERPGYTTPEQRAALERRARENCRIAQENLRVLESAAAVVETDARGEETRLDPGQREAKLAETQRLIELYCTEPAP